MNWKKKIQLKHIICSRPELMPEDDVPTNIIEEICEILEKEDELKIFCDDLRYCNLVCEFNDVLEDIYDYCDNNGIWLG